MIRRLERLFRVVSDDSRFGKAAAGPNYNRQQVSEPVAGQERPVAYVAFRLKADSNRISPSMSVLTIWTKKAMEKNPITPPFGSYLELYF